MPFYDFECNDHGIFEKFISLQQYDDCGGMVKCELAENCTNFCEVRPLPRRNRVNRAYLRETVYFENEKGEVQLAGAAHDTPPPGFQRKTIQLKNELEKLQRKLNMQDLSKFRQMQEGECERIEREMAEAHSDMRQQMQGMHPISQEYARMAMQDAGSRRGIWERSGEHIDFGYFEALENDEPGARDNNSRSRKYF